MIIDYDYWVKVLEVCVEFDVDGLWGDIVINWVVKVLVVFEGCIEVIVDDIS